MWRYKEFGNSHDIIFQAECTDATVCSVSNDCDICNAGTHDEQDTEGGRKLLVRVNPGIKSCDDDNNNTTILGMRQSLR